FNVLIAAGVVLASGCVHPVPSELGQIKLTTVSSASVEVQSFNSIKRAEDGSGYVLQGYVVRKPYAVTTARTHLHIRFLDANGNVLHEEIADFHPREITDWKVFKGPTPDAKYAIPFKNLPQGTAQIEVRAQDGS
ncbi:MAG TPA: hypothetical protein VG672_27450, partial [Bryobacteraceae bacterium]|nr:hypothetical protein [Bryobacteraceae bacterium]